jgi:GDP-L-fucose synthase
MKVLVLGSNGFIGSSILREALGFNFHAVGLSRKDCDFLETDKLTNFIKREAPDFVINAAGVVAGIQGNLDSPFDLLYKNSELILAIARSCINADVDNYISFSAACIYPSDSKESASTSDLWAGKPEISSLSYATSKILGLQLNESVNSQFGLKWKTIIPSNLYGYKDSMLNLDRASHVLESLIAKTLYAKKSMSKNVEVWGDGTPQRTFLHVKDLALATLNVMENADKLPSVLNVNGGTEVTIKLLAESIAEFALYEGRIVFNPQKPNGALRKNLDDSILRSTGWRNQTDFFSELKFLVSQAEEQSKNF